MQADDFLYANPQTVLGAVHFNATDLQVSTAASHSIDSSLVLDLLQFEWLARFLENLRLTPYSTLKPLALGLLQTH